MNQCIRINSTDIDASSTNLHRRKKKLKMVGVAQLVESRFVDPVVAGSSPVAHPKFLMRL